MGMTVTAFTTSNRYEELHNLGASEIAHSTDPKSLKDHEGKYDLVVNTLHTVDENIFKGYIRLTKALGTYV